MPQPALPIFWEGDYKVTIGDVNAATQAQNAVLAAAIANGGDETNLDPGIAFFAQLAEQGRLDLGDTSLARLESGEIEVGLFWDFNALNYANQVAETNPNASFEVTIRWMERSKADMQQSSTRRRLIRMRQR